MMCIDWKRDFVPHPSHTMTEYASATRTPVNTSRFYSVSECTACELETGSSVAGEYYEVGLEVQCEMISYIEDINDVLKVCGSVHPNLPKLTCQHGGGKCTIDWHISEFTYHNGFTEMVTWGKDVEEYARNFGYSTKIMRIVEVEA